MPHANPHLFHPSILREYDIRGIIDDTLTAADAYAVGRAFGSMVRQHGGNHASVAVGRDGRLHSPILEADLIKGLLECGVQVKHIGVGPTPMLYFAARTLPTYGAVMITGSHNPPEHNGFKFMLGAGALYGNDIKKLGEIAAGGVYASGKGSDSSVDVKAAYIASLQDGFRGGGRKLKVAWDAGNGAAGEIMAALAGSLPGAHILLNEAIDGSFPSHHPDPSVAENLAELIATVRAEKCDCGLAFDGDGDRVGVVDDKGNILWGDQIMVVLAREVLARRPGAQIIADVKASEVLFEEITKANGVPTLWKTGHSLVKARMAELGAALAGEMSGHIFFADHWGFDDGLYAAVRFIDALAYSDKPLSAIMAALPKTFSTPELRIPCSEERKFAVIEEVKARLKETGADIFDLDGVRVKTEDGWWLLRASNTQAALSARCEGKSEAALARLVAVLKEQLAKSGIVL